MAGKASAGVRALGGTATCPPPMETRRVARVHSGNGPHEERGSRAIACSTRGDARPPLHGPLPPQHQRRTSTNTPSATSTITQCLDKMSVGLRADRAVICALARLLPTTVRASRFVAPASFHSRRQPARPYNQIVNGSSLPSAGLVDEKCLQLALDTGGPTRPTVGTVHDSENPVPARTPQPESYYPICLASGTVRRVRRHWRDFTEPPYGGYRSKIVIGAARLSHHCDL